MKSGVNFPVNSPVHQANTLYCFSAVHKEPVSSPSVNVVLLIFMHSDDAAEFPFIEFEAPDYATHPKKKRKFDQRVSGGERMTSGDLRQTHDLCLELSSSRVIPWLKKKRGVNFQSPFISSKIFCESSPSFVFLRNLQLERADPRGLGDLPSLPQKPASCQEEGCTCLPSLLLSARSWHFHTHFLCELPQDPQDEEAFLHRTMTITGRETEHLEINTSSQSPLNTQMRDSSGQEFAPPS